MTGIISRKRGVSRKLGLPLIADLAVIAVSLTMFNFVQPGFDLWIAIPTFIAVYGYIAVYFLSSIEVVRGIKIRLSLENAFVIFYYILFFWPYQKEILGIGGHYYYSYYISNGYAGGANKALLLSIAGLAAFHLGNVILSPRAVNPQRNHEPLRRYAIFDQALAIGMVLYFALFIALDVAPDDLTRYRQAANFVRADSSAAANGAYLITILLCLIGVARIVSQLHFGGRLLARHWTIIAMTSFWMLFILVSGDRNNFLVIAIGAGGGVAAFLRETRWPLILAAIVPALIVYSTIEVYRQAADKSLAGLQQSFFDANSKEDDKSSFALTTLTVRATVDIAPTIEPYAMGYYKLVGFGGIVPFVRGFFIGKDAGFSDTSQVIQYYILGPDAAWSLGSNPISDLYFDFGPIGVAAGLALLGYAAGAVRSFVIRKGPSSPRIFLYIATLAMMSEVPRYSLDFPVRIVVWGYLVFWLYEKLRPAVRLRERGLMADASRPQHEILRHH